MTAYRSAGLEVNCDIGKSEIMATLRGRGAKAANMLLRIDGGSSIAVDVFGKTYTFSGGSPVQTLRGSRFDGRMVDEIHNRVSSMRSACNPISKNIFANDGLPVEARLLLVVTLALSRLLFNSATWHLLSESDMSKLHTAYMFVLRRVAGMTYHHTVARGLPFPGDHKVLEFLQAPTVRALIRRSRLMFLARWFRNAPVVTLALVQSNAQCLDSWACLIVKDLAFLKSYDSKFSELPDPAVSIGPWLDFAVAYPQAWRTLVTRATSYNEQEARSIHSANSPFINPYQCGQCDVVLGSWHALRCHAWRAHGIKKPIRQYVVGSLCAVCMREFHTRDRLLQHLAYDTRNCRDFIFDNWSPLSEDELHTAETESTKANIRARATGQSTHTAFLPSFRVPGPIILH